MVAGIVMTDGWTVYVGRDKYENEELIKYGWPEDVWYHVDDVSSPHVYLRLPPGKTIDDIPAESHAECCQLTKEGSISGSKMATVRIVFTPWSNLRKDERHDVGTVTFHNMRACRYTDSVARDRDVLRRIEKTKEERKIDLEVARKERDEAEVAARKSEARARAAARAEAEKRERADKQRSADLKSYKTLFEPDRRTGGAAAAAAAASSSSSSAGRGRGRGAGRGGAPAAAAAASSSSSSSRGAGGDDDDDDVFGGGGRKLDAALAKELEDFL